MKLSDTLALSYDTVRHAPQIQSQIMDIDTVARSICQQASLQGTLLASNAQQWAQAWLTSKQFVLLAVPLNLLAAPQAVRHVYASSLTDDPIVVDMNKRNVGATVRCAGPKVIVVHGVDRFLAASKQGHSRIKAWVGTKAAKHLGLIQADHDMSSDELYQAINQELASKYPPTNLDKSGSYPSSSSQAFTEQVYPFENYFIYNYGGKKYRQAYQVNLDRTVSFNGPPAVVEQKYVDSVLSSGQMRAMDPIGGIFGCACDSVHAKTTMLDGDEVDAELDQVTKNNLPFVLGKNGKPVHIDTLMPGYLKAVRGGWKPKVQGKAAPGWEGTVKHMKKHSDIDNPWALSHYLDEQGAKPHYTKTGKKKS